MKKVLVVDDSALMRRVLSDIINKDEEFHTEHSARDGLEALKLMEQNDFDDDELRIIISDHDLVGCDLSDKTCRAHAASRCIILHIGNYGGNRS